MAESEFKLRVEARPGLDMAILVLDGQVVSELTEPSTVTLVATEGAHHLVLRATGAPGTKIAIVLPGSEGRPRKRFEVSAAGSVVASMRIELPRRSDGWAGPRFSAEKRSSFTDWPGPQSPGPQ